MSASAYIVKKDYRKSKYIVENWYRNFDLS